jgi:hypothetical protein
MKVDAIINVYGKPWHTLCTLKSLLKHSGQHIDKIYLIIEKQQPYNDSVEIEKYFDNLIVFTPEKYYFSIKKGDLENETIRYNVRYQYGIEKSDKKYVFILHNDVLFTGDIVGEYLSNIDGYAGIGHIGMCWNCPAEKLCNREKFDEFIPDVDELIKTAISKTQNRTLKLLNRTIPIPLPECRLNEWACLIDKDITMKECIPFGNTSIFGMYDGADLGCSWFRELYLKGYRFKHYQMFPKYFYHGYWAKTAGYPIELNEAEYKRTELIAKQFYLENYDK